MPDQSTQRPTTFERGATEAWQMLRRDLEYVLTWDAESHSWTVRPFARDGDRIVQIGEETTHIAPVLLGARTDLAE
ncbi:MAG TPA: hypothetical protein VIP77_08425 [Jiangellaceae bacterium]